jgi:predicted AlkP superfamily phosphohydrolase/phosphomutase
MASSPDATLDVLLVGIDAACRPVVDRLAETDAAPTLSSLLSAGATGALTSQIPPWTPSAWPSLYTGVNPGAHGVFDFLTFDGYDWDVVDATRVREASLWELLDARGLSSVVVNVPVTHPPPEIDGAVVPGYTAPEDPECHPPGLLDDLRDELGEYRVYAPTDLDDDESVEWYRRLTRLRGEAFRYLVERFDPDFGFVQFQQTDTVFHELGGDFDAAAAVYDAVDEQVDALLSACDPDTVVVVSDHGIGAYGGYEFRVNEFLRRRGFVKTARGGEGMPSWDAVAADRLTRGNGREKRDPSPVERALALAAKAGLTSQRIGAALEAVGLDEFVLRHVPADVVRAGTERVDFSASTAYVRSRIECGVRVNLRGREPDGVVPPDEYERVRDELVAALSAVETPDGDPVFETVARREEFFDGPYVDDAVDVVTIPTEMDHFLSAELRGQTFSEAENVWDHQFDGVVAAAGEGVDADADLSEAHLFDVAPTILTAMGVPYSDRMDGGVLPVVEGGEAASYPEYDPDETPDRATAGEDVQERLADLGYVE